MWQTVPVRLVVWQLLVTLLMIALWQSISGSSAALAALAGGLIGVISNAYYAIRVFSLRPGSKPEQMLGALYRGEIIKLLLTFGLFVLAIQIFARSFVPLITAYMATAAVYFMALLWRPVGHASQGMSPATKRGLDDEAD